MHTQSSQLRKKVANVEKSERYLRGMVNSQKVTEKDLLSRLSAADRERVE
jgi:hypothetical protein